MTVQRQSDRRRYSRYLFGVICFLLAYWPAPAGQDRGQILRDLPLNRFPESRQVNSQDGFYRMPTALGDDYFDGASPVSRLRRHFSAAHRAGVKYLRCAFSWNGIEPEPDKFEWKFWDTLVSLAEQNRIGLIPYVAYTPQWAARHAKDFWKQPPRDPQLYADFMFQLVARYRGRVSSWEIWNEPDNKDYWLGTAEEFADLTRRAARRIREADPHAVLVLGGMANGPSEFFGTLIKRFYLDRTVDVIAMHAYPESWLNAPAETIFQQWVPQMRQLMAQDRSGDDLWVNEMGYPDYRYRANQASVYGTNVYYRYEHTRRHQAVMLFKMEVMALATRQISLTGWYRIDDFPLSEKRLGPDLVNYHLGVEDWRGRAKPALSALAFFNRLLGVPARVLDEKTLRPEKSQSVVNMFRTREGKIIVIGWLRGSLPDEVPIKNGMLQDERAEIVATALPCSQPRLVAFYDAEGHRIKRAARLERGWLRNIRLRGDSVFVAELGCGQRVHAHTVQ
jgi:Glycosyl hydrolases family 39